jgi:hypothetical protein
MRSFLLVFWWGGLIYIAFMTDKEGSPLALCPDPQEKVEAAARADLPDWLPSTANRRYVSVCCR